MIHSNGMTLPPAMSQSSLSTGVQAGAPQPGQGSVSWAGSSVAHHEAGAPHLSGHHYSVGQGPSFGSSPFQGCVVDHGALSMLKEHSHEQTREIHELRTALRDAGEQLQQSQQQSQQYASYANRADVTPERLSQLLTTEQLASMAEDRGQRLTHTAEKLIESHAKGEQAIVALRRERDELIALNKRQGEALKDIKSEFKEVSSRLELAQFEWNKAQGEADKLTTQLESMRTGNENLSTQLDHVMEHAVTAESKMKELGIEQLQLKKAMSELETTNKNQQRHIDWLNGEIQQGQKELSAVNSANSRLAEELDSHKRNGSRLHAELSRSAAGLKNMEAQLADSKRSLAAAQEELAKTQTQVHTLSSQLTNVDGEKNYESERAKQLKIKLETCQVTLNQAKQDVASLQAKVDLKEGEVDYLRNELKKNQDHIEHLSQHIQLQRSELSGMGRMQTDLEGVKIHNNALQQSLEQQQKSHQKEVDNFVQEIRSKEQSIRSHLSSIEGYEKTIGDLKNEISSLNGELNTAKSQGNPKEREYFRHNIEVKEQEIAKLQEQQIKAQMQTDSLSHQVKELHGKLAESQRESQKRVETLDRQTVAISEAKTEVLNLRSQLKGLSSIKQELLEIRREVDMNKQNINDCESNLQKLTDILDKLRHSEVDTLLKQITQGVSEMKSSNTDSAARLRSLEAKTESLENASKKVSSTDVQHEERHVSTKSSTLSSEMITSSFGGGARGVLVEAEDLDTYHDSNVRGSLMFEGGEGFSSSDENPLRASYQDSSLEFSPSTSIGTKVPFKEDLDDTYL
ncbi:hypothetical protein [Endozoicomonas sp. SCSIO W0465]|uniref:hypothetical protein n=1 Tax=Endozoicomonas sp. SCSIO W0465 TaxID=2918516 RepID=UPI002075BC49|nr:hypothetical protein [Endozoicomonas sp. SCSIO W0465]USE33858.1 hypothetical protein MJO57_16940 [Endozoicomonas sp. SCSIO W0465]